MSGRIFTGDEVREDLEVECDVCVIGSGSGGAWLAHELVAAGKRVVMLEEGGYHTSREFDLTEATAFKNLYQELGNRATDDLAISVVQGRSVGGGTTVNWTTSFRTPKRILELWRARHGAAVTEEALAPHWAAIEERLHISEWPLDRMNKNNRVLYDGAGKLGYHRAVLKRNVNNCANIGYCGMGCPIDAKQSMLATLVPDAVEKGLMVYANVSARYLETGGRKVLAIHAEVMDPEKDGPAGRKLVVRPRTTVVSAGAINSPALLLRSDLDGNGRVGRRTFLHPGSATMGEFEEPIEAFTGAPQSAFSNQFEDRGRGKLGYFLEAAPLFPMMTSAFAPGFGPAHQRVMQRLPHLAATVFALIDGIDDDDEGGTVSLRSKGHGRLRLSYPMTERVWEGVRSAVKECARIQFAAGAKRVFSLHAEPVVMESERDLDKLDAAPYERIQYPMATFHQMGGCAMGKDPAASVVDPQLRYHGLDNLFVVDGSVLPTSLGVNPQQTIFGLARWASQHVLATV